MQGYSTEYDVRMLQMTIFIKKFMSDMLITSKNKGTSIILFSSLLSIVFHGKSTKISHIFIHNMIFHRIKFSKRKTTFSLILLF